MKPDRYHPALRVLHWLIAALIITALVMGSFVMTRIDNADPAKRFALLKHMLAGALILALTLVRLFVRPRTRRPAPVLSGIAVADRIVPSVHRIFDVLVIVIVASGAGLALFSGLPGIIFFGAGALPGDFEELPLHALHVGAARLLAGVIAVHVIGALYHVFVLRDGLLKRMSLVAGKNG